MSTHRYSALLTDLYELTMLAGYFEKGMHRQTAVFDMFFRHNPYHAGYAIFAGLQPLLEYLSELRFTASDLAYLKALGIFKPAFLDFLEGFRFRGKVTAPTEGTAVFAAEPLVTVEGELAEAQLVETALLNIINFQTLVATKAARIVSVARPGIVVEFGLRRAHGPDGGLSEARAAFIGGARSTSNTWAGQVFDIPIKGTHAHSWVMAFPDELSAFRAYADCFPDQCILLVDTYDTLASGVPNAIIVARELRASGHEVRGIRLDSGDLAYLSKEARRMLDEAGFPDIKIVASSDLDETVIQSIRNEGGCVDIYGVGTQLATCGGEGGGSLGGVYKLVRFDHHPKLKVTSDIAKATLPDRKRLLRAVLPNGEYCLDVICLEDEEPGPGTTVFDPVNPARTKTVPPDAHFEEVRQVVMQNGQITRPSPSLDAMADRCVEQMRRLPNGTIRLTNPHIYKVAISSGLHDMRTRLMQEALENQPGYREE
ncbi:nicotinate phosphoribosyltransferase [Syntrophotalea carbinolica DSM 2380]|uniref:Nicotinate phosphoribosyltransferase n=1 Tax=Syntrophotalea carbinolica (strain DSM 2380 / NBRC 103641 / GraBd1) TaxID=338963 RepID=Q3A5N6_SYNC1|nr:nicotinate phosphoribosyltransferase [Syntrophotalea carbinolica]ABA88321.1 nicotinate phosphoribosyltransferase [Syntrophotalea carbinolica DSM 2380]